MSQNSDLSLSSFYCMKRKINNENLILHSIENYLNEQFETLFPIKGAQDERLKCWK